MIVGFCEKCGIVSANLGPYEDKKLCPVCIKERVEADKQDDFEEVFFNIITR